MEIQMESAMIQEILRLEEDDPSLLLEDYNVTPGCSHGDNYMSTITRVRVRGIRHAEKKEVYTKSLVVKRQPDSEVYRALFKCGVFFLNEKATYFDVLPAFQRFSRDLRRLPYPKCLFASEEMIVLEDLQPEGFKMADRMKGLDLDHCILVFQELARFHAISLAMKVEEAEKFELVRNSIKETMYITSNKSLFNPSLKNAFKIALYALRTMSATDPTLLAPIKSLENINKRLFKRMMNFVRPREPFAVINHGDCWINNFLFKYRDDGNVEAVKIVDLQVTRYSSPAIDILHFLYTSTHEDLRRSHFDALLLVYHKALSATLRRLITDKDVESIFTLDQLKYEMRVNAIYGLINGLWMLPAVTVEASTLPDPGDITKEDLFGQENVDYWIQHQTQEYKDRCRYLVLEYIERGYLV